MSSTRIPRILAFLLLIATSASSFVSYSANQPRYNLARGSIARLSQDPVRGLTQPIAPSSQPDLLTALPLQFEPNLGQADSRFNFVSRAAGYNLLLSPTEARLILKNRSTMNTKEGPTGANPKLTMRLVGAKAESNAMGQLPLPGRMNYLSGRDSKKFVTDVPTFQRVKYSDVYPGIDVVYYGQKRQLEHDFIVAPGVDPKVIALQFEGADDVRLGGDGDLIVATAGQEVRLAKPFIYQETNGQKATVAGGYRLQEQGRIAFDIGPYDPTKELVIDPVLFYSSFFGGSGADAANDITLDSTGNIYVTGATTSAEFSRTDGSVNQGSFDVFVTKLNPTGTSLIFSTLITASGNDSGLSIGLDANKNVYVSGLTDSAGFPTTPGAFQTTATNQDGFALKLNTAGNTLMYSTRFGGPALNNGSRLAVDPSGDMYLAGSTYSSSFPTTSNAFRQTVNPFTGSNFLSSTDSYVAKIHPGGNGAADLLYSTYLGGNLGDEGKIAIVLDANGFVYVSGYTQSTNFPTTPDAIQPLPTTTDPAIRNGQDIGDAFLVKMDLTKSGVASLVYSTYVGGTGRDVARGLAIDSASNVYLTGRTDSDNFPVSNAPLQSQRAGGTDVYVMKINIAKGSAGLEYSTYLGGNQNENEFGGDIAVDNVGNAYVTGDTRSTNLPVTVGAFQPSIGGSSDVFSAPGGDAFAAKLNAAGTALVYFTYLGGSQADNAGTIAIDARGNAYIAGYTFSPNFPLSANALQSTQAGQFDAFVACIDNPSSFGHSGNLSAKNHESVRVEPLPNPIDDAEKFVRQQYLDFLSREPDASGLAHWTNEITSCGTDANCISIKRINVSAAFFLSIEFQETGYLVYRLYLSSYARQPRLREFSPDSRIIRNGVVVGQPGWEQTLANNKQSFVMAFVQRPEFLAAFPLSLTADQFVTQLDVNAGGVLTASEKAQLVSTLGSTPGDPVKRASVLRAVAENPVLQQREKNKAFVLMEYLGYMQRNPSDFPDTDDSGYLFWLAKLEQFNGNFVAAEMVNAFITSGEYRTRFGQN